MTARDLAAALIAGVPRYADEYENVSHDPSGSYVKMTDALAALSRALDPAIAERAGEVVTNLRLPWFYNGCERYQLDAADLITALLAQNAALRAERDKWMERCGRERAFASSHRIRADAAEAEVEKLRGALRIIGGNNCITCSAEAFNVLFAERHPPAVLTTEADPAEAFDNADWFWRTMDPDDCGDSPEEAINRAMVGRFCVCEIASSYAGPTRYGFIAPVLDPESDDEEFVHFATQQEAIDAAKARAALTTEDRK